MDVDARSDTAALVATRSRDEWMRLLDGVDACVAPVLNLGEALEDPLARERGMVQVGQMAPGSERTAPTLGTPIRIDGRVQGIGAPPPRLGEHTREVAREAGFTELEIDDLLTAGVLASGRVVRS